MCQHPNCISALLTLKILDWYLWICLQTSLKAGICDLFTHLSAFREVCKQIHKFQLSKLVFADLFTPLSVKCNWLFLTWGESAAYKTLHIVLTSLRPRWFWSSKYFFHFLAKVNLPLVHTLFSFLLHWKPNAIAPYFMTKYHFRNWWI